MTDVLTEPAPATTTDEGPLTDQSEIDRLLDEAQNLASEIADQVRLEGEDPPQVASASTAVDEAPAAEEAVSPTSAEASAEAVAESEPVAPPSEAMVEVAPPPQAAAAIEAPASVETVPTDSDVMSEVASVVDETPPTVVPAAPTVVKTPNAEPAATQPAKATEAVPVDSPPKVRKPLGRRLAAAAMWPVLLIPRTGLNILVLLDKPFGRVSPLAKQRIGYVAVLTLIMAGLARILPDMMKSNPYEHITDFPQAVQEAEAGHDSGGEHSAPAKPAAEKKADSHH